MVEKKRHTSYLQEIISNERLLIHIFRVNKRHRLSLSNQCYLQTSYAVPSPGSAQWVPKQEQMDLYIVWYEETRYLKEMKSGGSVGGGAYSTPTWGRGGSFLRKRVYVLLDFSETWNWQKVKIRENSTLECILLTKQRHKIFLMISVNILNF